MVDLKVVDVQLNELPKLPIQSIGYHSNFVYNNKYYVLGGVSAEYEIRKFDTNYNSPQQKTFPRHKTYTSWKIIYAFDIEKGRWSRYETRGTSFPDRLENTGIVIRNNSLVVFGGWSGAKHTNRMWRLDLVSLEWREEILDIKQIRPTPRAGHSLNLVDSGKTMLLFGGQGNRAIEANEFPIYDVKESEKYKDDIYNNQSFLYDFESSSWIEVGTRPHSQVMSSTKNTHPMRPPPRAYHSCTGVGGDNLLLVFGGRNCEQGN